MAREILFRGKRSDNGEWTYGYFGVTDKGTHYIDSYHVVNDIRSKHHDIVDPATVGQLHNGLSKKAGVNIFVGDIIRHDLEAGLGQPKRIGLTETVRSVEFDFHYYSNVRLIGTIHDTHLTKQS